VNYISQTIVFALALMGTLFKSTKTDANGKTIYTTSGLPALTTTGGVVVILLAISFGISLITIWQKNKSEDDARAAQRELKAYNEGIDETLKHVFAKTSELSDDQKKQFEGVLRQQRATGDSIADGINTSGDLLRGRIESSSTLLNRKLGTSIDLLNHSASQVASLADPITTVEIRRLIIEIPLTDPTLANYRGRVEPVIRRYPAEGIRYRLGCQVAPLIEGVAINPDSDLLPNRIEERAAYNLLRSITLDVFLFKTQLGDAQIVADSDSLYDLHLPARKQLKPNNQCDKGFLLFYDVKGPAGPRAFILADLKFVSPANAQTSEILGWKKAASGRINGIPDLASSQIVVRVGSPSGYRDIDLMGLSVSEAADVSRAVTRVRQQSKLIYLNIVFSQEHFNSLRAEERVSPTSVRWTTLQRVPNGGGYPYYVYNFPPTGP